MILTVIAAYPPIDSSNEIKAEDGAPAPFVFSKSDFDWHKIIRFAIEEVSRRLIGKSTEVPSRRAQANNLNGKKTEEIIQEALKIKGVDTNEKLNPNELLDRLNRINKGSGEDKTAEEAKYQLYLQGCTDEAPWIAIINDDQSEQRKIVEKFDKSINKNISVVGTFIRELKFDGLLVPESMAELKYFSDPVVSYAMLFQNTLHPSNKNRREAIESGKYKEILTTEDANEFFGSIYKSAIELEISAEESRILMENNARLFGSISDMALLVKDIDVS